MPQLQKTQHKNNVVFGSPISQWGVAHPWMIRMRWKSAALKENKKDGKDGWVCNILPGFVNGVDPYYAPARKGLCSEPDIVIPETKDETKIPLFFKNLGAVTPESDPLKPAPAASGCCEGSPGRFLKSCQIWIQQARVTFSVAVDVPFNVITGQLVDYQVTYNSQALKVFGNRVRLFTGPKMPDSRASTLEERLAGAYGDDGVDTQLIATVFFLSLRQDDPNFSKDVDDTWIPYVMHKCFWNLGYQVKNNPPIILQQNPLDPYLAWFVGRYTFAPAAAYGALQAEEQRILQAVYNSNDNAGIFYTI